MSLVTPEVGLVIRYSYLWHSEYSQGREEGVKDRPCAMILTVRGGEEDRERIIVLPVTHTPPYDKDEAIEIPPRIKRFLGLDDEPSWIVLTEWNEFFWPSPDLRRVGNQSDSSVAYGILPHKFYQHVREKFVALLEAKKVQGVPRTE